jgi:dipeptidyl-peptidase-4
MDHPTQVEFTRDGRGITYLAPEPGGNTRSLWRLDLAHGTSSLLAAAADPPRTLTRAEQLSRQRRRETSGGITAYRRALAADVITMRDRRRWLVSRDGKPAGEVPGIRNATAVYPDPAGRRIAWASAGDLWRTDLADDAAQSRAAARRLSQDGRPGVSNGLEDYLAAEELDRFDGAWWSMGGGELLFAHVDERHIPLVEITAGQDLAGQTRGEAYRYPFAGGPNPRTTLRIAAADDPGLRDVSIDFGDGYLARVLPHPLGGWLVAALPRDQHSLHWYLVQPSGAATELWAEHAQPWINLDEATRILSDGRVVRASEATGFRHLELRAAGGTLLRRLTGGEWVVTELVHVDEARAEVLFIGTADSVLERHLYVVPLDATQPVEGPRRLTTEPGWHAVTVSDDGKRWVDSWSSRDLPTRVVVRSRDGSSDVVVHEASSTPEGAGLVVPDLLTVPAADGATPIHVALFHPPRASDAPPGPTVVWVYGGPHSQYVRESWELTVEPFRQALVRAGFTVILADNRGTANRGLRFESPIAGAFGDVEIDDQAAVLDALALRGEVDLERVAISGSSYGGFLTVRAMTIRPDLFRAGVAWAPVVDWAGYDTAYTERYLALPTTNAEGYRRSSLLTRVGDLQGRLLVTHGTVDENVHPRHTERLLAALRAAGRDADSAMLPRERHLLERPLARRRWLTLALDHLRDAMGRPSRSGAAPRAQAAS